MQALEAGEPEGGDESTLDRSSNTIIRVAFSKETLPTPMNTSIQMKTAKLVKTPKRMKAAAIVLSVAVTVHYLQI